VVNFYINPSAAVGRVQTLTDDPCVVEHLSVVQLAGILPRVTMEVYDFDRVDRIRYVKDRDHVESDASLESDDPETTMIVLEGEDWVCRKSLGLQRRDFHSHCEHMFVVRAAGEDRAAALAALEVIRESCALP
jgi:hypothetical protein